MIGGNDLKDFECPICLEFCRDAVESDCCAHAFCSECADDFVQKKKSCPCCRSAEFKARESRLMRRIISQIKVECINEGCEEKLQNADKQKHEMECPFRKISCRYCDKQLQLREVYHHTIDGHSEETKREILGYYMSQSEKSKVGSSLKSSINGNYNPLAAVKNAKGREARFGDHVKYYCGGDLLFKCRCCDGYCGPTNGENCIDCMRLDMQLHKLSRGQLVNALGNIVKIEEGEAYCGILIKVPGSKQPCTLKNKCSACMCLTSSLPRYKALL